jgi:hypothetical protein
MHLSAQVVSPKHYLSSSQGTNSYHSFFLIYVREKEQMEGQLRYGTILQKNMQGINTHCRMIFAILMHNITLPVFQG